MASNEPLEAERRCILTRASGPRAELIRLALGPAGEVAADLGEKLPGRGAWVSADRALIETAMARGQLQGALVRALKQSPVRVSETLADDIARGLEKRILDQLGLCTRAGLLVWGHERISDALGKGRVVLLLHAADAGEDGSGKLEMKRRAACPDSQSRVLPFDRGTLSVALGRGNVVSAAIVDAGAAARVRAALARWVAYQGLDARSADGPGMTGMEDEAPTAVAGGVDERHETRLI
ncbi:MAG: DUF448 domain-containing protein [Polymorphobacter sp.]|uniref:DUF448 domain-containing protein n=1 Tax=Polymorphobacter sp. TaxID=1909290 RepID=UPI003A897EEE